MNESEKPKDTENQIELGEKQARIEGDKSFDDRSELSEAMANSDKYCDAFFDVNIDDTGESTGGLGGFDHATFGVDVTETGSRIENDLDRQNSPKELDSRSDLMGARLDSSDAGQAETNEVSSQDVLDQKRQLVSDFIASSNPEAKLSQARIDKEIENVLSGIDMKKEVSVVTLKKGEVFCQFQEENRQIGEHPSGNWFSSQGVSSRELGISGESIKSNNRVADYFVLTEDVSAIKSTALDAHSWYRNENGKESGELLYGGETQYYCGDVEAFQRVVAK